MSQDVSSILAGWDFNPDEIQVRLITGDDGQRKIQMRVDLGVLQMELAGRPDGQRPHGFESLLEYYEAREQEGGGRRPGVLARSRRPAASSCARGCQYYHRYLSAFHLRRYDLVCGTRNGTCGSLPSWSSTPPASATRSSSTSTDPTSP